MVSKTIQEWDGSETSLLPEWMVRSIDRGYGVNDRGEPVAILLSDALDSARTGTAGL